MSFSFFSMTGCSSIKTDIPNADISSECLTEANFLAVAELPQRMVGNPSDPNSIPGVFRLDGWDIRYVRTFTRNRITFAKTGTNYTLGFVSNEGGELKITPLAV